MSSSSRGARYWISAWSPVLVGILVISIESTEWFGADHTSGPLRTVWQAIFGHVSDPAWELIHHYIRKSGHFIGYGFIGLAWLRAWWMTLPHLPLIADGLLALLGTAVIASADEFHQSFLPNRTSSPWDVLIDCTGAFVLQLLAYLVLRILRPRPIPRQA